MQQNSQKQQDILYLQGNNTSPRAQVIGMMLIEDGELCGHHESFQNLGGQSWPLHADRTDLPYGFPRGPREVEL